MAIGPTLTALFPGDLLSVALYYCAGAGMGEDIAVGVVGFLLSPIVTKAIRRSGAATVRQADGEMDIQKERTLLFFHCF